MPTYAVTGASGHLGRLAVQELLARGVPASDVAAFDASIARGDLETSSQDLAQLLGRPATPLTDVVGAAHDAVPNTARDSREH